MTAGPVARRGARVVSTGIVLAATAVVALIALAAVVFLGRMIDNRWQAFPETGGVGAISLALLACAALAGGVHAVRRVSDETLRRWTPIAPLLLLVVLRLAAVALAPTPVPADNDPRYLHELAVGVLDGGNPLVAHRPMGYSTLLAILYAAFGVNPVLAELLNVLSALLAGWALFVLADRAWGRRVAAMSVFLYAVVPSQVLMATAIFTETLYGAVLLAAIALASAGIQSQRLALLAGAGIALAVSQYVRPVSQSFLVIFAAAPLLAVPRLSRGGILAIVFVASFLVAMTPIVAHNIGVHGDLSLSTSSYGGWSVFVGANQEHDGRFNRDDQAILAEAEGRTVWERSEILGRAGIDRITSDPLGFAALAVRKFRVLWGDDTYAVANAFPAWESTSVRSNALRLVSQAIYVAVASLAMVGLWRSRHAPSVAVLLLAGIIVTVAVAHVVVEVQPRYHAYLVPLLCALAAVPLAGWRHPAPTTG